MDMDLLLLKSDHWWGGDSRLLPAHQSGGRHMLVDVFTLNKADHSRTGPADTRLADTTLQGNLPECIHRRTPGLRGRRRY